MKKIEQGSRERRLSLAPRREGKRGRDRGGREREDRVRGREQPLFALWSEKLMEEKMILLALCLRWFNVAEEEKEEMRTSATADSTFEQGSQIGGDRLGPTMSVRGPIQRGKTE